MFKSTSYPYKLLSIFTLLGSMPLSAQTPSPVQATIKSPLSVTGPVYLGGSDESSTKFLNQVLPQVQKLLNGTLGESKKVDDSSMRLDPAKLNLATASDVRVYFVGEGAGYSNSLGFNALGIGTGNGDPSLIFPNASSIVSYLSQGTQGIKRTTSAPLLPGDFVDLGTFKSGSQLDFFMIADGANNGKNVYTANASSNPDKINHVVAFALENSPYLIVGFEDLFGGGDRDFNDLLFAVEIGASNVAALIATPEPAAWLTMLGLFGYVGWTASRMRFRTPVNLFA